MTTFARDPKALEPPWQFTGRDDELELVRRSLTGGRAGAVVTGPAGCGRTRLVVEAVRGIDHVRVTGTPGTRGPAFAAFAHLLPEPVTLHRALHLLSDVRLLVVDDAHLLDDASAALVHQLAVQGRTRLLVTAVDGPRVPDAVSRLWTGDLLPRLVLAPLPHEAVAQLLGAGAGSGPDPLTVTRLYRLCRGDLRLLRELSGAVRERGARTRLPDSGEWAWRGPVPVTTAVRERAAAVLDRTGAGERVALERLAFAEPLSLSPDEDGLDLAILERLEADGCVHADEHGRVRLAHPLYGPVLRALAGRLRAGRLSRAPGHRAAALERETAALRYRIAEADVHDGSAPLGEWLVAEGVPVPAEHAAVRAAFARLRGELREAAAWAREGLRTAPGDRACRVELALAVTQSGAGEGRTGEAQAPVEATGSVEAPRIAGTPAAAATRPTARRGEAEGAVRPGGGRGEVGGGSRPGGGRRETEGVLRPGGECGQAGGTAGPQATPGLTTPTARPHGTQCGETEGARAAVAAVGRTPGVPAGYDAVRLGRAERGALPGDGVFARHADALARRDGPALDRAAEALEERGFLLFAAEAYAQAVGAHRDPRAARVSRTRAMALARRCQGARTPALNGLVLGELTARQRQIVTLAAAGLSNREIAERLTLSVRTVGNHLYGAYTRLGAGDRGALPWLVELPAAEPA
ncbi:hypothetical protein WN71_037290 [Streptomyces mangrovisoli]|uniref:HTH luxR-type domain-containing protein n=1 Tax=Streptomyces mangrovisoli TaxID=1428628 RepID=A0A1J4NNW3_9ACTN|nr:hypothetical protein WN71_037290 [Streptomyces mangrovisoli]